MIAAQRQYRITEWLSSTCVLIGLFTDRHRNIIICPPLSSNQCTPRRENKEKHNILAVKSKIRFCKIIWNSLLTRFINSGHPSFCFLFVNLRMSNIFFLPLSSLTWDFIKSWQHLVNLGSERENKTRHRQKNLKQRNKRQQNEIHSPNSTRYLWLRFGSFRPKNCERVKDRNNYCACLISARLCFRMIIWE